MNALTLVQNEDQLALQDPVGLAIAKQNILVDFVKQAMVRGRDYGEIPGTSEKPVLLKPGAEKLCNLFRLQPRLTLVNSIEDWEKGFFSFDYRCTITDRKHFLLAECEANCNSKEKKYRYRRVSQWQATQEEKDRAIRTEKKRGKIGDYTLYVVENNEPYDLVNTIRKMSQKRAIVGATLLAVNASMFFQNVDDIEAIVVETEDAEDYNEVTPRPQKQAKSAYASEAQVGRFMAIATKAGYTEAGIKKLASKYGITTRKQIPLEVYDALVNAAGDPELAKQMNLEAEPPLAGREPPTVVNGASID